MRNKSLIIFASLFVVSLLVLGLSTFSTAQEQEEEVLDSSSVEIKPSITFKNDTTHPGKAAVVQYVLNSQEKYKIQWRRYGEVVGTTNIEGEGEGTARHSFKETGPITAVLKKDIGSGSKDTQVEHIRETMKKNCGGRSCLHTNVTTEKEEVNEDTFETVDTEASTVTPEGSIGVIYFGEEKYESGDIANIHYNVRRGSQFQIEWWAYTEAGPTKLGSRTLPANKKRGIISAPLKDIRNNVEIEARMLLQTPEGDSIEVTPSQRVPVKAGNQLFFTKDKFKTADPIEVRFRMDDDFVESNCDDNGDCYVKFYNAKGNQVDTEKLPPLTNEGPVLTSHKFDIPGQIRAELFPPNTRLPSKARNEQKCRLKQMNKICNGDDAVCATTEIYGTVESAVAGFCRYEGSDADVIDCSASLENARDKKAEELPQCKQGEPIAEDTARIEPRVGIIEFTKGEYKINERATVELDIEKEGRYRVDWYIKGDKVASWHKNEKSVASEDVFNNEGTLSHAFQESGKITAKLKRIVDDIELTIARTTSKVINEKKVKSSIEGNGIVIVNDTLPVRAKFQQNDTDQHAIDWYLNDEKINRTILPPGIEEGIRTGDYTKGGTARAELVLLDTFEDLKSESVRIPLKDGWNMISPTYSVDLRGLKIGCDNLKDYKGSLLWRSEGGDWRNEEILDAGKGYYVLTEGGCNATVLPYYQRKGEIDRSIEEGWNTISVARSASLNSVKGVCRFDSYKGHKIWYNNGTGWENPSMSEKLDPKKGYYVLAEEKCNLLTRYEDPPEPPISLSEAKEAGDVSQCVKAKRGACGCGQGGRTIAINKEHKDAWTNYTQDLKEYRLQKCPSVNRCTKTRLVVEDGKCELEDIS